ncbi:MAG: glycosyltransferase [Candidatus Acidiferrales bacterium]
MTVEHLLLAAACIPFVYYLLSLYSTMRYFRSAARENKGNADFTPPVSCLKPVKGADEDAYENYASFCRQDYPDYEILFCVDKDDPTVPVLEQLVRDFPERRIRLLFGSGRNAVNDKVARLTRLVNEAQHDIFVITDSDVRVRPEYLRTIVAPFHDPKVGAATCLYASTEEKNLTQELQSIGMICDFFPGVLVAWQLDGVKFTFGQTIITTRKAVAGYGGYPTIEDRPADDVWAGRLVAEQGYEVKLLPYVVHSVADFRSLSEFLYKRLRWMTVMRLMRPWGHLGLIFTWGLFWSLVAIAIHPSLAVAGAYLGAYLAFRIAMTWMVGVWGMKQSGVWKKMPLIPLWDAMAFAIWLASFGRRTIRWRGIDYYIREGKLVSAATNGAELADQVKIKTAK